MRFRALELFGLLLVSSCGCRLGASPYPVSLESPDPTQRIEAIAMVVNRGDRTAVAGLVDRLDDEDEGVRFYAILGLERLEGTRLGYDYAKSDMERRGAVRRWREYVKDGKHLTDPGGEKAAKTRQSE